MDTVAGEKDGVGGEGDILMIGTWNVAVMGSLMVRETHKGLQRLARRNTDG